MASKKSEVGQEPCMSADGVPCPGFMICRHYGIQCKAFRYYVVNGDNGNDTLVEGRRRLLRPLEELTLG